MTEKEAIEVLEKPSKHIRMVHETKNEMQFYTFSSDLVKAFEMAIKALEDIQAYRALGTVEDIETMKENGAFTGVELASLACMQMKLRDYQAIGTVEEIQKAIENLPLHQVEHKLLQKYQNIGTVRLCKIAVERMKPKKPDYEADGYADGELVYDYAKCPVCGHDFEYGINDWECKYCSDCGQKLDWE